MCYTFVSASGNDSFLFDGARIRLLNLEQAILLGLGNLALGLRQFLTWQLH